MVFAEWIRQCNSAVESIRQTLFSPMTNNICIFLGEETYDERHSSFNYRVIYFSGSLCLGHHQISPSLLLWLSLWLLLRLQLFNGWNIIVNRLLFLKFFLSSGVLKSVYTSVTSRIVIVLEKYQTYFTLTYRHLSFVFWFYRYTTQNN